MAAITSHNGFTADADTYPVLPGMYPDPSICRVGDEYFIATSSMEYSPAAPIWQSSGSLVAWKPLGNALTTEEQFPSGVSAPSRGMYAPTLRHRAGTFYLVTTNVDEGGPGQSLYTASSAAGPWSAPLAIPKLEGIDPDIAWDDQGVCLMSYCAWDEHRSGIKQAAIDPVTGEALEEPRWIWEGTGLSHPEGPHLYRRSGWWYLVIAEGGTERGHVVSVARSKSPRGPFVSAPGNPVLTHRSTRHTVQNVGHADLVELDDGSWAAVYLGVRVRGGTPRFHVNGRETFLSRIEWVDDWPVFVPFDGRVPARAAHVSDSFASAELDGRWVSPGLRPSEVVRHSGEALRLAAARAASGQPSGLFTRVVAEYWRSEFVVTPERSELRMMLRLDDRHWYAVRVHGRAVEAVSRVGDVEAVVGRATFLTEGGSVTLVVEATSNDTGAPDTIGLGFVSDGIMTKLARLDGRYLSTEVAGGFTGRTVGLVVDSGEALVHGFRFDEITAAI
jgi:xylan 1,4-beta-xylosidase